MVQAAKKIKFATQADPETLDTLRQMAQQEGKHLQTLINEALHDYVERKQQKVPQVLLALQSSINQFDDLYQKLAQ